MLRLHARPGQLVPWPGQNRVGQVVRYIGRSHKVTDSGVLHAAQPAPVEIDETSPDGRAVVRLMTIERTKPFWPADKATADLLGVPFTPVKLVDGEWVEDVKPAKSGGGKDGDK